MIRASFKRTCERRGEVYVGSYVEPLSDVRTNPVMGASRRAGVVGVNRELFTSRGVGK